MQDVNVVIIFDSRDEEKEKLALAAAVGAVQGRANIRLRRQPGTPEEEAKMEYVEPREADAAWADAVISGVAAGCGFEALEAFSRGTLVGKVGAALTFETGNASIYAAMCGAGFITLPVLPQGGDERERARLHGRRVAEAARALRTAGRV